MDFYLQQLRAHRPRLPPQGIYHCVDGAFATQKYLAAVVRLKLHPITKLRGDANCRFLSTGPHPQRRGARRTYDGKVNWQDLHRLVSLGPLAEADHVQLSTTVVWHVTLTQPLRVGVLVNRQDPAKQRSIVLAATALALAGHNLVTLYGARFQIEFLFRDSKQCTGLSACQARAEAALAFHFNAALATLNLARAEAWQTHPATARQACSMASWKQRRCNERLRDGFIEK
jgi:putative transposase